ncbi:hypothetical protein [Winogradskyella flava]|uniref:hypothetical protein n=1 Tax=Winogradskyella flava TaxID=1884876 RepID=UPI002493C3B6|nr:hypothetical protein [Winogradskyella flava]
MPKFLALITISIKMIDLKKHILTILFCVLITQVHAQSSLFNREPLTINHSVIDTVEVNLNGKVMDMLWINDTIQVRIKNKIIKVDSTEIYKMRRALRDSTYCNTQEKINNVIKFARIAAQNCYSYAIEKYFDNSTVFNQSLFNSLTHLSKKSAEKILANYFTEIDRFLTNPKHNLKQAITDDVLLAFLDKYGSAMHFVYYNNGIFYSKNGGLKPIEFQSLKKFLKTSYWDTEEIVIYKIDEDKLKSIITK